MPMLVLKFVEHPTLNLRPGATGIRSGLEVSESSVELGALFLSEREDIGVRSRIDAIPEILGQLEPLSWAKLGVIEERMVWHSPMCGN
jgi:hypothetical protein